MMARTLRAKRLTSTTKKHVASRQLWLLTAILFVSVALGLPLFDSLPIDGFLYLQYAKNLLNGNGFVFNADEPHLFLTGPLWGFVLALGGKLMGPTTRMASALSLAVSLASVLVFYLLARRLLSGQKLALSATSLWALDAYRLRLTSWGTELPLTALLVLLGIYLHLRERDGRQRLPLSPLVFGLALLCRPESALLFFLAIVDIFLNGPNLRDSLKRALTVFLLYISVLASWAIYAHFAFGSFTKALPENLLARLQVHTDFWASLGLLIIGLFAAYSLHIIIIGTGLTLSLLRQGDLKSALRWIRAHFLPIGWLVGVISIYLALSKPVGLRYMLSLAPLLIVYALLSFETMVKWVREDPRQRLVRLFNLWSFGILAIVVIFGLAIAFFPVASSFGVWQVSSGISNRLTNPNAYAPLALGLLGFLLLQGLAKVNWAHLKKPLQAWKGESIAILVLSFFIIGQHLFLFAIVFYPYDRYEYVNMTRPLLGLGDWLGRNTPSQTVIATDDYPSAIMVAYASNRKTFNREGILLSPEAMASPDYPDYYVAISYGEPLTVNSAGHKGFRLVSSVLVSYFDISDPLRRRPLHYFYYNVLASEEVMGSDRPWR